MKVTMKSTSWRFQPSPNASRSLIVTMQHLPVELQLSRITPALEQRSIVWIVITRQRERGRVGRQRPPRHVTGQKLSGHVGAHQAIAAECAADVRALDGQRTGQKPILPRLRV